MKLRPPRHTGLANYQTTAEPQMLIESNHPEATGYKSHTYKGRITMKAGKAFHHHGNNQDGAVLPKQQPNNYDLIVNPKTTR